VHRPSMLAAHNSKNNISKIMTEKIEKRT